MSSGISIEEGRLRAAPDQGFRPWHFFVLGSILLATVAVIVTRRTSAEHLVLLSVCMAAAGAVAATLYSTLVPLVRSSPEAPLTSVIGVGREALEREKLLTLRSIKELEFDRAMGKLSQKDFDEMAARLRQRAMSLMQALDAGAAYEPEIQREVESRLAAMERAPQQRTAQQVCACGTSNDPDAAFCKRCGTRLEAAQ